MTLLITSVAFALAGLVSWYLSSRGRLFVRMFIPTHERAVRRAILCSPVWRRLTRFIAFVLIAVAAVTGLVWAL